MPLFLCDECGVIENTALSSYWVKSIEDGGDGRALCSQCGPEHEWHGKFERQIMSAEEIAAISDFRGWVDCERLREALAAHDERVKAEVAELAEKRLKITTSPYPERIQKMPCGTRAERKAKKLARDRFALANLPNVTAEEATA